MEGRTWREKRRKTLKEDGGSRGGPAGGFRRRAGHLGTSASATGSLSVTAGSAHSFRPAPCERAQQRSAPGREQGGPHDPVPCPARPGPATQPTTAGPSSQDRRSYPLLETIYSGFRNIHIHSAPKYLRDVHYVPGTVVSPRERRTRHDRRLRGPPSRAGSRQGCARAAQAGDTVGTRWGGVAASKETVTRTPEG